MKLAALPLIACAARTVEMPSNTPQLRCSNIGAPPVLVTRADSGLVTTTVETWSLERLLLWTTRAWMCTSDVQRALDRTASR